MPSPIISVMVCTRNRCRDLVDTVKSLLVQSLSKDKYEIIIVNNASQDDTKQIVMENFVQIECPKIKYIEEHQVGLSYARNAGIRAADGEIIAFIDDDAVADKGWLDNLLKTYNECDADCVGGKVEPIEPIEKLEWLPGELTYLLAIVDFGTQRMLLRYPSSPAGVNISFRKKVFDRIGRYNTSLGRKGSSLLSREESDICYKIEQSGGSVFYSPDAVVRHKIHPSRLSEAWFKKRMYWEGRSYAVMELQNLGARFTMRRAFQNLKFISRCLLDWLMHNLKGDKMPLSWECKVWMNIGYIVQVLIQTITRRN